MSWRFETRSLAVLAAALALDLATTSAAHAQGPVHWWKADGNADDSAGTLNGTSNGSVTFSPAVFSTGFAFDDADDSVLFEPGPVDTSLDITATGFTASFWMIGTHNQRDGRYAVLDKSYAGDSNTGWAFEGVSDTGDLEFQIASEFDCGNGSGGCNYVVGTGLDLLNGVRHHVVGIYDGAEMQVYVDGVLRGSQPIQAPAGNSKPLYVARRWLLGDPPAVQEPFRGRVDDVRIYQRALSDVEVLELFDEAHDPGPFAPPTDMNHRWRGDINAVDAIAGLNGTVQGGTSFVPAVVIGAFAFDSDDDGVVIPHDPSLDLVTPGFSATFWMRGGIDQPQSLFDVVDKSHGFLDDTGWAFQGDSASGQLGFVVGNDAVFYEAATPGSVLDGAFHLIAGTWDGQWLRIYVDGVLEGRTPFAFTPASNTRDLNLAFSYGGGTPERFFRGNVDDLRLFPRALKDNEILAMLQDIPLPFVTIDAPADGAIVATQSVTVDARVGDAFETHVSSDPALLDETSPPGLESVSGVFDLTEGSNSIKISALDPFGNLGFHSVSVTRDTTPATIGIVAPVADSVVGVTPITLSALIGDATATVVTFATHSFPLTAGGGVVMGAVDLVEGVNVLVVDVVDAAGNPATASVSVTYDPAAPHVTVDSPLDGASFGPLELPVAVDATVAAVDATHVASTPAGIDQDLPAGGGAVGGDVSPPEGLSSIAVTADDGVGSPGTGFVTVLVDTKSPIVNIVQPRDGFAAKGVLEYAADASDGIDGTSITQVDFLVDGTSIGTLASPPYLLDLDTTQFPDGSHALTVRALDGKGNEGTSAAVVLVIDNTAPLVTIDSPPEGSVVTGVFDFTVTGTDAGSGLISITASAGTLPPTVDGSTTYDPPVASDSRVSSVDSAPLPDGSFSLTAVVEDAAGNRSAAEAIVHLDNNNPTRQLIAPLDGQVVSGTMPIEARSDDPDLLLLEAFVNDVRVGSSPTSPLLVNFDTTTLLDQPLIVKARVTDFAGNSRESSASVTVDNVSVDVEPNVLHLSRADESRPFKRLLNLPIRCVVEGPNLDLMLPVSEHVIELRLPDDSSVPALVKNAPIHDEDGDSIPDAALKFDRKTLKARLRDLGLPGSPGGDLVKLRLFVDGFRIGADQLRVFQ